MRKLFAALALVGLACSGGESADDTSTPAAGEAQSQVQVPSLTAAMPAAVATGTVHEVRMILTDDGRYVYQPEELTIRVGDTVRWINVSGGPHNVAFYADKIPAGAAVVLNAAMTNKMSDLSGELMLQEDQAYEMIFAGAPTGTYDYFCTPHEMLGMKASLTIND